MSNFPLRNLSRAVVAGALLCAAAGVAGQATAPSYLFTHLAGPLGGLGSADGAGAAPRFGQPETVTVDPVGNVYVGDTANHSVRKITPAGVVSTLAGPDGSVLQFSSPVGLAADGVGNVYVADDYVSIIYRIAPGGGLTTLAGAKYDYLYGANYVIGDGRDGTGPGARFFRPAGLAVDSAGNVYVADTWNHSIRQITPAGVVTTLAGTAGQSGSVDATGAAARFNYPTSVSVDNAGNLYVSEQAGTIRKITPGGVVTTLAGTSGQSGGVDGLGSAARFNQPRVAADGTGNLFVADSLNHTVRQITPGGTVTTLAGLAATPGWADGPGATARFGVLTSVAVDRAGNVYVADPDNFTIRKVSPGGSVATFAGTTGGFGGIDANGASARFYFPQGVTVDIHGNVFVADFYNHAIRKITPNGDVTTFAGVLGYSSLAFVSNGGAAARFYYPSGIAVDAGGNLYVAEAGTNSIRKVTADGVVSFLAGPGGGYIFGHADGPGVGATFAYPEGIAVDPAGTIYVADSGNSIIRKITPDGIVSTLAGTAGQTGSVDGTGPAARFYSPLALAADGTGTVYVADSYNNTIRKITADGVVTTLAGSAGKQGSADGTGAAASFNSPCGLTIDSAGNLFVGDSNNLLIRKVTPDGVVTTIGGKALVVGSADGVGAAANFYFPSALAVDRAGTLYIADEYNHAIRKGQPAGPPVITAQPLSLTVAPGGSVQFAVAASSLLPSTYQWYVNGSSFSGATASTLSFSSARASDTGDYTVVVTNELGSVISAKATLTVTSAPTPGPGPAPAASSGGGAIDVWTALLLLGLGLARLGTAARRKQLAMAGGRRRTGAFQSTVAPRCPGCAPLFP